MKGTGIFIAFLILVILFPAACLATEKVPARLEKEAIHKRKSEPSGRRVCPRDSKWVDICSHFNRYQSKKKSELLARTSVEQPIGEVCNGGKNWTCKKGSISVAELYKMGMSRGDRAFSYLLNGETSLFASLVDVDNDGRKELRLHQITGTAHCMRSYFWKKDTSGLYRSIEAEGYDQLAEDGSGCGAHHEFVSYLGSVYTVYINYDPPEHIPRIDTVWRGTESALTVVCTDCDYR